MKYLSKRLIKYLEENNWQLIYKAEDNQEETELKFYYHYTKEVKKWDSIYHIFIEGYCDGEVTVELGEDNNQQDSEVFKLRNLVSVLKRRGL